jgi:hypothetical protein
MVIIEENTVGIHGNNGFFHKVRHRLLNVSPINGHVLEEDRRTRLT